MADSFSFQNVETRSASFFHSTQRAQLWHLTEGTELSWQMLAGNRKRHPHDWSRNWCVTQVMSEGHERPMTLLTGCWSSDPSEQPNDAPVSIESVTS
jgi:hypothetical protein